MWFMEIVFVGECEVWFMEIVFVGECEVCVCL